METRAPHVLQLPHIRAVMGSLREMSAFPLTIQWGLSPAGCLLSSRIWLESGETALYPEHLPRKVPSLPQQAMLSQKGAFPICTHPGFAELLGTQRQVLGQEGRALPALWLQHSSAWGQSCTQPQLQRMFFGFVFFYFIFISCKGEKKGRQKGCNTRSVPLKCATGEIKTY